MGVSAGNLTNDSEAWRLRLLESGSAITAALASVERIAVIGMKTAEAGGPAFYVPQDALERGYDIVPVPVYFPEVTSILDIPVHRSLRTIAPPVDSVVLFRRPSDIPQHLDDLLAARPRLVWMQLGIRHEAVAETLAHAGIAVVQDHCLMVELERRALRRPARPPIA
ncbi:MAG: CoA-binding protein [Gemmatimonadaceae bacterium]|nr:CoA-binding protein [Gemmatimonadaceae bacterium]